MTTINLKVSQKVACEQQTHYRSSLLSLRKIGNVSKGVFEGRTSTGSETFFLLICLHAIKFVSRSFFTPVETI